ncbi:unnamed protein product [Urochloa humidicola]
MSGKSLTQGAAAGGVSFSWERRHAGGVVPLLEVGWRTSTGGHPCAPAPSPPRAPPTAAAPSLPLPLPPRAARPCLTWASRIRFSSTVSAVLSPGPESNRAEDVVSPADPCAEGREETRRAPSRKDRRRGRPPRRLLCLAAAPPCSRRGWMGRASFAASYRTRASAPRSLPRPIDCPPSGSTLLPPLAAC